MRTSRNSRMASAASSLGISPPISSTQSQIPPSTLGTTSASDTARGSGSDPPRAALRSALRACLAAFRSALRALASFENGHTNLRSLEISSGGSPGSACARGTIVRLKAIPSTREAQGAIRDLRLMDNFREGQ